MRPIRRFEAATLNTFKTCSYRETARRLGIGVMTVWRIKREMAAGQTDRLTRRGLVRDRGKGPRLARPDWFNETLEVRAGK